VVATLIDFAFMFVVWIVVFVVSAIFGAVSSSLGALVGILGYIAAIGIYGYFLYMTGITGQSPGKRVHGIKVISENTGQPLGGPAGILRYFAHIPDSICMIGYLFPLWDPKKQTFADKIQTSVVVANQPKQAIGPDLFKI